MSRIPSSRNALDRLARALDVEGRDNVPGVVHSLIDLEAVPTLDEGLRLVPLQVVVVLAVHPLNEHHVPESPRGDQSGRGLLPLQQRVGRDRRAVDEPADRTIEAPPARGLLVRRRSGLRCLAALVTTSSPVPVSKSARSVNVPPTSTPTLKLSAPPPPPTANASRPGSDRP